MKSLRVSESFDMSNYSNSDDVNNAIREYEIHLSVKKISKTVTITSTFHFLSVDKAYVEKLIGNLNSCKVELFKNIPKKCLKVTSDICSPFLAAIWNQELIFKKKLPQKLKLADITPAYKKNVSAKVKNRRYKWKHLLEKNGFAGAILMDLSKAFGTRIYESLIAKLQSYGFGENTLDLVYSYLENRQQRVKINTTFSTQIDLNSGVPPQWWH